MGVRPRGITATYPDVIVTPYVMLGASDSRHFTRICDAVYRFTPFEMSADERGDAARPRRTHPRRDLAARDRLLRGPAAFPLTG